MSTQPGKSKGATEPEDGGHQLVSVHKNAFVPEAYTSKRKNTAVIIKKKNKKFTDRNFRQIHAGKGFQRILHTVFLAKKSRRLVRDHCI